MMQYIKCLLMYHSVGNKSLRWPFEVLITWKRVKPGAMFFDEKLYLFHGLSYGIREICEFFASFNLTCFCCACVCQSSVILDYFKRYASSRQRGFHFVLYQKNAMKWRKIWMKKKKTIRKIKPWKWTKWKENEDKMNKIKSDKTKQNLNRKWRTKKNKIKKINHMPLLVHCTYTQNFAEKNR